MRLSRKSRMGLGLGLVLLLVSAAWWLSWVPEPKYKGVGLGIYMAKMGTEPEPAIRAVQELGVAAVPYLVQEVKRHPMLELANKAGPKLPSWAKPLLPNWHKYMSRRTAAAALLKMMGKDAAGALPAVLELAEQPDDLVWYNIILLATELALGTEHEGQLVRALIAATKMNDSYKVRFAYEILCREKLKAHKDEILLTLARGMHVPGMGPRLIAVMVKKGTNAIPALKEVAARETNHVRPATMALEIIAKGSRIEEFEGLRTW